MTRDEIQKRADERESLTEEQKLVERHIVANDISNTFRSDDMDEVITKEVKDKWTCLRCGQYIDPISNTSLDGEKYCPKTEDGCHVFPPSLPLKQKYVSNHEELKGENYGNLSVDEQRDATCRASVRLLLRFTCGRPDGDPDTKDTPNRVTEMYKEMTQGYSISPREILSDAIFEEKGCDEIVIVKGIPFVSLCQHHLLPFAGIVDVGYIPCVAKVWIGDSNSQKATAEVMDESPNKYRIVGLSKIARLVDCFSQRLQLQERLTREIAEALVDEPLKAQGVAVVVRASHNCMACRGVKKAGAIMITSSMLGIFRDDQAARQEFLSLCRD